MSEEKRLFVNDKSLYFEDCRDREIAIKDFDKEFEKRGKYNKDNILIMYESGQVFIKNETGKIVFYTCVYEPYGYVRLGNTYTVYGHETIHMFNVDTGESVKEHTR